MHRNSWLDKNGLNERVLSPDLQCEAIALQRQGELTKPAGSLGQLESLAVRLAALQKKQAPSVEKSHIVIFAADHGIVSEGVSAFPQAVTLEMIRNFSRGGAAISVLAKSLNIPLQVLNLGTVKPLEDLPGVKNRHIAAGTQNFLIADAMREPELQQAFAVGKASIDDLQQNGCDLFIGGEMGIGNTTSATAMAALVLGLDVAAVCGAGTGLDTQGVKYKVSVINAALAFHQLNQQSSVYEILQKVGGLEIAALCGAYIRCGQLGIPVLVDGFICSVAAFLACKIQAALKPWLFFSHQSAEPGHALLLAALDAKPLLQLNMRLGEASGAALALPLIRSACLLHNTMATFTEADVSTAATRHE